MRWLLLVDFFGLLVDDVIEEDELGVDFGFVWCNLIYFDLFCIYMVCLFFYVNGGIIVCYECILLFFVLVRCCVIVVVGNFFCDVVVLCVDVGCCDVWFGWFGCGFGGVVFRLGFVDCYCCCVGCLFWCECIDYVG